jgi:glycosyltransferase involved in cell wall biosynthesis
MPVRPASIQAPQGILPWMPRLALLAPVAPPSVRGNAITVERIVRGLRERGIDLRVWDLSRTPEATIATEVEAWRPALVHAFHARLAGALGLALGGRLGVPLVVTLTGTDANHDLLDGARGAGVRRVLEGAAAVTAFHSTMVEHVAGALPSVRPRLVVVPQAPRFFATGAFDLAGRWPLPSGRVLFVFPAGIRAVKAPRLPLGPLEALAAADARVRLAYAGPILDPELGAALQADLATRPWARYLGEVPHEQMASLLGQADVVLNCSISEGGLANSVLEALALGRAVLASDIPGNRGLIVDGVTGLLFRDPPGLATQAARLAADAGLRARLGAAGRALVAREYPVEREIDGYLTLYRSLTSIGAAPA